MHAAEGSQQGRTTCPISGEPLSAFSYPNFRRAFERFLLHTGGRGVIESIQEGLSLSSEDCQASYDTLHRFGNTSAASTWWAHPPLSGQMVLGVEVLQQAPCLLQSLVSGLWQCTTPWQKMAVSCLSQINFQSLHINTPSALTAM